jgi:hypothetical protein
MVDMLILEGYMNAWVRGNAKLSAAVVEGTTLFSMVDRIVVLDTLNLYANYTMKYLKGGLGTYADGLLAKMKPDLTKFLKERNVSTYQITFEFRAGENIYRTRQIYY